MKVRIIDQSEQLHICEPFTVSCLLWGTKSIPSTWGRICFLPKKGFLLKMTCQETNPKRTFTQNNSPVYKDSAMEAFFQFCPGSDQNGIYLNFEMNANGALLAMYGADRANRTLFTDRQIACCHCRSEIAEHHWSVYLTIPISILHEIYGEISLENGTVFSCNFYKISEDPDIEHYASYVPVISATPNFHLPEYFESSVLDKQSPFSNL